MEVLRDSFGQFWDLLFWQLGGSFWNVVHFLGAIVFRWALPIVWFAWWLWGVNWNAVWPILRSGAWVVVIVFMVVAAMVWAQLAPSTLDLGTFTIANFWWQLAAVGMLVGLTLCCGVLQEKLAWAPREIDLEPVEEPHGEHAAVHGHH